MLRMTAGATVGAALHAGLGCSEGTSTTPGPTDPTVPTVPPPPPTGSGSSVTGMPLPIPEPLSGSLFNLEMRIGGREFLQGLTTPTKGYNGDFLGPTLFLRLVADDGETIVGSLYLFEAEDRAAVDEFQRNDPLVAADIWETVEVRAFIKRVDNRG